MRDPRILRLRRGWSCATPILLAAVALFLPAPAQAQDVTVQQLIDAIFTDTYDPALDLDGDGFVDIADIVCLHNNCHKDVWFSEVGQTVNEGSGEIQIHVEFEQPLTTTLFYSIGGTATAGSDFTDANGGTIVVDGASADIPIQILNDGEVNEEIETIVLRLEPGSGYRVGGPGGHTLTITDNDSSWHGTLQTAEGRVAFVLELVNDTGTYTARILSDGMGTFPSDPDGYAATRVDFLYDWDGGGDDDIDGDGDVDLAGFEIDFEPITMGDTSSSLGLVFTRTYALDVNVIARCETTTSVLCLDDTQCPGGEACVPDAVGHAATDTVLAGDFTELAEYPGRDYLSRETDGTFSIGRQPSPPSSMEAELYAGTCSESGHPCNDDGDCPGGVTDTCVLP